MNGEGVLQTLAEVSIALAGFGSLLVVLRRDPTDSWSEAEGVDFLVVVGGSLIVLFFALSPLSFFYLGFSESAAWSLSSGLFALALVPVYVVILKRRRRILRAGVEPLFPNLSRVLVHLPLVLVAILFLNAGDLLVSRGVGTYLLVLILLLAGSAFPLIALVIELGAGPRK